MSPTIQSGELVLFYSGDLLCGLDLGHIREINRNLDIARVHRAPEYVRGVLNLRGQLLTIIDLRRKLNLQPTEIHEQMRVLVVRREEGEVGLLVDQVVDIVAVGADELEAPPANLSGVEGAFFSAVYTMEEDLAAVLDLECVLEK